MTIVIRSCSAYENNQWSMPQLAYASDDARASEFLSGDHVHYKGFDFDSVLPVGAIIDFVQIQVEGYITGTGQDVRTKISWNGGSSWGSLRYLTMPCCDPSSEDVRGANCTADTSWTRDKLLDSNLRVHLEYYSSPTEGCFPPKTYFVVWSPEKHAQGKMPYILKEITKLRLGDLILCSNHEEGLHFEPVAVLTEHVGTWSLRDIWSGKVKIKYKDEAGREKEYEWAHHGRVTDSHPVLIWREGAWLKIPASEVRVGDGMRHVSHAEIELEPEQYVPLKDHYLRTEPIYRIKETPFRGSVFDVKTADPRDYFMATYISDGELKALRELEEKYGVNLGSYVDPREMGKWSAYVDHVQVRVDYHLPSAKPRRMLMKVGL